MAKKELGSVTRTMIAVGSGFVLGQSGLSVETLILIATNLEAFMQHLNTLGAVLGIIVTQTWSLINKSKQKQLEKKVNEYENLND
jgi:high-affinity nickel permease